MQFENDPMVLRGSPYAEDAVDRSVSVEVPSLFEALQPLGETMSIAEARAMPEVTPLDNDDRRAVLDQTILVLNKIYIHRALKHTKHAVDPVAALKSLRRRAHTLDGFEFHLEVMRIFKRLQDIHTAYTLPRPYCDMVAFLPFLLGGFRRGEKGASRDVDGNTLQPDDLDPSRDTAVIVTGLLANFSHPTFGPGVEVLSWNGLPIHEAIRLIGREEQGSNVHAQFELGLRLMSVRWLGGSIPPDEYFVTIVYRDTEGELHEIRFPWRVMMDRGHKGRVASVQAMWDMKRKFLQSTPQDDPSIEKRSLLEGSVRDNLFEQNAYTRINRDIIKTQLHINGLPEGVFDVQEVRVAIGKKTAVFGLVKIEHFVCRRKDFVAGFSKILAAIPQNALVIDIRSNPGGMVNSAESILQLLTPQKITPLPFQFLATQLVESIVRSSKTIAWLRLKGWDKRVTPAVDIGNQYSRFGTLTKHKKANDIGQRYYGTVALITNAVTYSSGDIFAASFQDHGIGPVVGVDPTTGGGGANMWSHEECVDMAEDGRELAFLPGGAVDGPKLHYAVRRCTRIGPNLGMPIEEAGISCDILHEVTCDDLLFGDVDLLRSVAEIVHAEDAVPYTAKISVSNAPIDMSQPEVVLSSKRARVRVQIDIRLNGVSDHVEHVLSINGVPKRTAKSVRGRVTIKFAIPTGAPVELRVDSHVISKVTGHSERHIATMRRKLSFVT